MLKRATCISHFVWCVVGHPFALVNLTATNDRSCVRGTTLSLSFAPFHEVERLIATIGQHISEIIAES